MAEHTEKLSLVFHPLTSQRWRDFEQLFGERGACGGCWCMWFRLSQKDFEANKGEGNRSAMRRLVDSGEIPGILAYNNNRAVGWCSVAPREKFTRLQRSRILKPVDDLPVWSIVCLYVDRKIRRMGVSCRLLAAACDFVKSQGGKIVEGYPVEPKKGSMPDIFAYHGLASAFLQAGFQEIARRSATRPIMRSVC